VSDLDKNRDNLDKLQAALALVSATESDWAVRESLIDDLKSWMGCIEKDIANPEAQADWKIRLKERGL